jgi:replicative DNA helicase
MASEGRKILFFSLEQPVEQIIGRFLSMTLEIPFSQVMLGDLHVIEEKYPGQDIGELFETALNNIDSYAERINIIDNSKTDLDMNNIKNLTRKYKMEKDIDVVFIDYLQFIKPATTLEGRIVYQTKLREVTEISRGLKEIAMEENVALFVLSQLSRNIEQREEKDKSPKLSDLRDSGALEQDADVVMFLSEKGFKKNIIDEEYVLNKVETTINFSVSKNRNGPTGMVPFLFKKSDFIFEEIR